MHSTTWPALCYTWQPWCSILLHCFPWILYSLGSHLLLYLSVHLVKNTGRSIYDAIWLTGSELHHITCTVLTHKHTQRLSYSSILSSHLSRSGHNGNMLSGGNQRSLSIIGLLFSGYAAVNTLLLSAAFHHVMEQSQTLPLWALWFSSLQYVTLVD